MKKIVSLCLLMVLFVGVCACFVACEEGSSDSPSYSYSYEPEVLTISEKEEIAEDEALRYISQRYPFNGDGTRYKIGSRTSTKDGTVTVRGQLFTYDLYGNYCDSYIFTCVVSVSDYGVAEVEDFDYKIQ